MLAQKEGSVMWEILCIIIGDVHQFISHCFIPLVPWILTLGMFLISVSVVVNSPGYSVNSTVYSPL